MNVNVAGIRLTTESAEDRTGVGEAFGSACMRSA